MSRICWTSWHCVEHIGNSINVLVRPKPSQGRYSTRVRLGNKKLNFIEEFRYLGSNVITTDCRDDKDIKKQFWRQNTVGDMLVRKFSFAPVEAKSQLFKSYCYPIYGCALWRRSYLNSIRKLTVSYSDTFKRLLNVPWYTTSSHLRWTQLTISMWCSANLLTAWWAE